MKRSNLMVRNISGFTLVELIVTMAVFLAVIVIAAQTFDTIFSNSARYSKSEESNIEGIIGLEVLRHDLEQMGFGLPWQFKNGASINYEESADAKGMLLNDASHVPRAFVGRDGLGEYGSDFIAIKASTVGVSKASSLWTYIPFGNFSTVSGRVSRPVAWPSQNLKAGDMVISVRSNFNDEWDDHILEQDSSSEFSFAYDTNGGIDNTFLPETDQKTQMVYGITDGDKPRMPFNRADFFVNYSSIGSTRPPSFCAEKTGVLYKAVVRHNDGTYASMPLLDCVADMQVVLGWDTSNKGLANTVDAYSSMPAADGSVTATPASAASLIKKWLTDDSTGGLPAPIPRNIREHLKVIKVYILAQEGRREKNYTYPTSTIIVGKDCTNSAGESSDIDCGSSYTRQYTLSAEQRHFRWKLYRVIVRPKTLVSNQR